MPTIQCPECGVEFVYTGHKTGTKCPNERRCGAHIQIGGPPRPREDGGLSIDDVRDRLAEREKRTTPP